MSNSDNFQQNTLTFDAKADKVNRLLQKGQRILYKEEEAEVISVRPLLVIKTKNRVVCGTLQKDIKCVRRKNTHV